MRYFYCEDGFIGVTNQCPKGMKGLVYVGRGPQPGGGIESVGEQEYSRDQLEKLKKVPAEDVPDDWFAAIGLKQCPRPEPRTVELAIQFPWENRNKKKLAKPGSRRWRQEWAVFCIALAISLIVAWYIVFV